MKLKFKSLQGSTFTVEADPSDTIASLKGKIEAEHGHQAGAQKIIFSGKILTDNDTVQSCGASEKDFLVLMVSKPKAPKSVSSAATPSTTTEAPKDAAAASTATASSDAAAPAGTPTASSTASSTASAVVPAPAQAAAPATDVTAAAQQSSGPPGSSQFLTGAALEQAVNGMVEMGFDKSEVQKAMRASFNNPERAVEYLMTGIPEHLNQPQAPPSASAPATAPAPAPSSASAPLSGSAGSEASAQPTTAAQPAGSANPRAGNLFEAAAAHAQGGGARGAGRRGAGAGAGDDSLAALRDLGEDDGSGNTALDLGNPAMIAQLRQLVQQNPAALTPLVQALAQSNPQLANAMADDPEAVLSLLANSAAGGEEGEEGVSLPGMEELSPEDRSAVEQIVAMGIEESKAIEVYLMCGRNVEMAVQYYFENPQDFDD